MPIDGGPVQWSFPFPYATMVYPFLPDTQRMHILSKPLQWGGPVQVWKGTFVLWIFWAPLEGHQVRISCHGKLTMQRRTGSAVIMPALATVFSFYRVSMPALNTFDPSLCFSSATLCWTQCHYIQLEMALLCLSVKVAAVCSEWSATVFVTIASHFGDPPLIVIPCGFCATCQPLWF